MSPVARIIAEDALAMEQLRAVRRLNLPDWCIAAGFVRNRVWDHLHGIVPARLPVDIDVLYFDAGDVSRESEAAFERQLEALFRDIGWIENGLAELGEGARPLLDWLRPIAEALHAEAHPPEPEDGRPAEPPVIADPIAAFRAFESWYEAERGEPFLQVFDRYVPPTPVVEF